MAEKATIVIYATFCGLHCFFFPTLLHLIFIYFLFLSCTVPIFNCQLANTKAHEYANCRQYFRELPYKSGAYSNRSRIKVETIFIEYSSIYIM